MKKIKLFFVTVLSACMILCTLVLLTACGGSAKITASYTSPSELSYSNMRPNYNYYTVTFAFQTLEVYDDGSYVLMVSSSTYSAVILPEDGNDVKGNERANYIMKYYGTFTSKVHEYDKDTTIYTLSSPTRIVAAYDQLYFADSDNWKDEYNESAGDRNPQTGEVTPTTLDEWKTKNTFKQLDIDVDNLSYSFKYSQLDFTK